MRYISILGVFLMTNVLADKLGFDRLTGQSFASRSEVIAQNGMAATSHPLATQVAINILQKGGSAVDAAIAANAVLGLVEPTGCGIGGDLFAIIWDNKKNELKGLNASGKSPQSLLFNDFDNLDEIPYLGPLPITVPGAVDGWFEMHDKYGKLSMLELLQPAIDYAKEGFPVSETVAWLWNENSQSRTGFKGFMEVFMPDGRAPMKGEIFKNHALASTYMRIAENGRDEFYKGQIARDIHQFMKENNGYLSYSDLENHKSEWVDPVSTNYRGYEIYELPPNTQGIAALQLLNILEGYDIGSMGFASKEYIHTFVEAKKLVYEDRAAYYADPDFSNTPINYLISKEYAKKRRQLIDPKKAAKSITAGDLPLENGDTIYLTVADKDGNMVSLIQSNYGDMGAGLTPPNLGFSFQNRGQLFSLKEGHPNVYAPNKRPFHTIIPAFVTKDNKPYLSFGLMGGSMQPQGHAQIIVNLVDFGMNLQEAGDAARIRHSGSSQPTDEIMKDGGKLYLETSINNDIRNQLKEMGHNLPNDTHVYGGYQAIMYDSSKEVYVGASDPRKDGQASGY
tara:strand:+ start:3982 stop:5676 length:1695 start_codon:yes stop_codon:yes gene_type:complete